MKKISFTFKKIFSVSKSSRVICIASEISADIKRKLFTLGVIDVLQGIDPDEPADYLNTLCAAKKDLSGEIIIWDDQSGIGKCVSRIAEGYGYDLISFDSIDALQVKMRVPTVQFSLINIASKGLVLKELVAKAYSDTVFKNSPVIIYKDLSSGIFVHEIVSGLNRLTNCIVDYGEMFSFLAVNLFKKRIIPLYNSFGNLISAESNQAFAKDTLSSIIFSRGMKFKI